MNSPMILTDVNGRTIHIGCMALLPKIPDWLIHDLPSDDVAALRKSEGSVKRVVDIDKSGYVWFGSEESDADWFCLKPNEIEVMEGA